MKPARSHDGQALVETLLCLIFIIPTLSVSARLAFREWKRFQCSYAVFENTHRRLVGLTPLDDGPWRAAASLRVTDSPGALTGSGVCGGMTESVTFQKLEEDE